MSCSPNEAYDEYCDQFDADIDIETFANSYGRLVGSSSLHSTAWGSVGFGGEPLRLVAEVTGTTNRYKAGWISLFI